MIIIKYKYLLSSLRKLDSLLGVQDQPTISNFHKMQILSNWPPPYELQQLKISPEKDLGKGFCKKHDQKKRGKDENVENC